MAKKTYSVGTEIDYDKVPAGTKFKADINEARNVTGKIQKDSNGDIYYCSNSSKAEGAACGNRLGYKYSWFLDDNVKNVTLDVKKLTKAELAALPIIIEEYEVKFFSDRIEVGCNTVPNEVVFEIARRIRARLKKKAAKKPAKKKK